jgi:hypothetical protein
MSINISNHPEAVLGSGLHRTVIVVEVLSNESRADWDLQSIARDIVTGDSSGHYEVLDAREISRQDMARALERQGSTPDFLLGEDAWVYNLAPGDEVTWNDPDEGECTRTLRIQKIEFHGDDIVKIYDTEGNYLEARVEELS